MITCLILYFMYYSYVNRALNFKCQKCHLTSYIYICNSIYCLTPNVLSTIL